MVWYRLSVSHVGTRLTYIGRLPAWLQMLTAVQYYGGWGIPHVG